MTGHPLETVRGSRVRGIKGGGKTASCKRVLNHRQYTCTQGSDAIAALNHRKYPIPIVEQGIKAGKVSLA